MAQVYNSVLEELEDYMNSYEKINFSIRSRSNSLRGLPSVIEPPYRESTDSGNIRAGGKYNKSVNKSGDGQVQLDSFTVRLPPSSTIQTATYWPEDGYLSVAFKSGHSYTYDSVPLKVIKAWMLAGSAGSFFYYNIRTSFRYSKA